MTLMLALALIVVSYGFGFNADAHVPDEPTVPVVKETELDVRLLQTMLNKVMCLDLTVDGDYGPATIEAVKSFQAKFGLTVDGVIGNPDSSATWAKLVELY